MDRKFNRSDDRWNNALAERAILMLARACGLQTAETKITGVAGGRLKTGDKIAAQVTSDGRALSIALQIPDSGMAPGLR